MNIMKKAVMQYSNVSTEMKFQLDRSWSNLVLKHCTIFLQQVDLAIQSVYILSDEAY